MRVLPIPPLRTVALLLLILLTLGARCAGQVGGPDIQGDAIDRQQAEALGGRDAGPLPGPSLSVLQIGDCITGSPRDGTWVQIACGSADGPYHQLVASGEDGGLTGFSCPPNQLSAQDRRQLYCFSSFRGGDDSVRQR